MLSCRRKERWEIERFMNFRLSTMSMKNKGPDDAHVIIVIK